jgi:hypothetical protein
MGGVPGVAMGQTCMSPMQAAGMPPMSTVGQPGPVMVPPCAVMSPTRAAGFPIIFYKKIIFFGRVPRQLSLVRVGPSSGLPPVGLHCCMALCAFIKADCRLHSISAVTLRPASRNSTIIIFIICSIVFGSTRRMFEGGVKRSSVLPGRCQPHTQSNVFSQKILLFDFFKILFI